MESEMSADSLCEIAGAFSEKNTSERDLCIHAVTLLKLSGLGTAVLLMDLKDRKGSMDTM